MRDWISDAEWFYRGHLKNKHTEVREEASDCHYLLDRAVRFSLGQPPRDDEWVDPVIAHGDFAIAFTVFDAPDDRRISLVHCCGKHCLIQALHGLDWPENSGRTEAWPEYRWHRSEVGLVIAGHKRQWCQFQDVPDETRDMLQQSAWWSFAAWQEAIAMGAPSTGRA